MEKTSAGRVYEKIEEAKHNATKSEILIIEKIRDILPNDLIYLSITELSDKIGVGEATVLRFCRKLGFKGFQDFKLMLSQDIASPSQNSDIIYEKIAEDMCNAIMQTRNNIDMQECEKIADVIIKSRRICFFAVGNSSIVATAAKYRLLKAGLSIETEFDPHIQAIISANLTKDDVMVIVSVSGSTKDMITIAEMAKVNETPLVVVTNHLKSPLAKFADFLMYSGKKEAPYEGGSLATVVAQSYIIDVLCASVFGRLGEKSKITALKASNAVTNKLL